MQLWQKQSPLWPEMSTEQKKPPPKAFLLFACNFINQYIAKCQHSSACFTTTFLQFACSGKFMMFSPQQGRDPGQSPNHTMHVRCPEERKAVREIVVLFM